MKRFVCLLLILCLLPPIGFPQTAAATGAFTDIPDGETRQAAELLYQLGIVSGTGGPSYSPDRLFDRATLAVIATRLSGIFEVSGYGGTVRFPDVRANHWAHRWINAATSNGLMVGGTDGRFHPEDPMLYGQLVTVLMKLLGYKDEDVGLNWPHSYIAKAEALGISKGMSFTANHRLTRGEAARLIHNFLFTEFKAGGIYIESPTTFGAKKEDNVLLLFDVTDGKTFIRYTDYVYNGVLDESLKYQFASILADKNGKLLSFELDDSVTLRQVSVKTARETRLELTDGTFIPVPNATPVFEWDGERKRYTSTGQDAYIPEFLEEEKVKLAMRDGVLLFILRDSYERQTGARNIATLLRLQTIDGQLCAIDVDGKKRYPVTGAIDAAQVGRTGVLMIDRNENALSFTPSKDYTYQTVTVGSTQRNGFFDEDGIFFPIPVPDKMEVWSREGKEIYDAIWLNGIPSGETLLLARDAGTLQYIYRTLSRGSGDSYRLAVLERQPAKGRNPLVDTFGKEAEGADLYKNGFPAELDMLERWDVLMFYEGAGVVEASNIRISGHHSKPRPNPAAPSTLELMGREFALLPEATARMSQYPVGRRFVFLLTPDGKRIADVRSTDEVADTTIGLAGTNSVFIGSTSLEMQGKPSSPYMPVTGRVGRVQGAADGTISVTPYEMARGGRGTLNTGTRMLGSVPLAPWCAIYEQVGLDGRAVRLSLSDIPVSRVPANSVLYAETGPAGYITAIVLDNVAGDAYIYGFADNQTQSTGGSMGGTVNHTEVGVSSNGNKPAEWFHVSADFAIPRKGAMIGVAVANALNFDGGVVVDMVTCVRNENLTRLDFDGNRTVRIRDVDVPLAIKTVFIPATGETMPIADALAYCKTFEAYTDPWGYKVRFITGHF
ncbi:MAG: S-layer homology domain-containing protein [Oscillospiraceae bacterium]|jgi:hypothetical protein|nr:S-layer homology domain-containing protein [Oscillospiraceae bacterium]